MDPLPDLPRYDVMLTPKFYIIKREEIALKYPFQARKLAPSILDEVIGEGPHTYEVFPQGDGWAFVAYDPQEVAAFLESVGGSVDRVRHLYFAEQDREKFVTPVAMNTDEALTLVNDTVTVVPRKFLKQTDPFSTFDEHFRPDRHFAMAQERRSFLDRRLAVTLSSVMLLLGATYIAEGYRYHHAVAQAEHTLDQLLDAHPTLAGGYARTSIYKKYTAINHLQRQMRDRLMAISHLTGKESTIQTLSFDRQKGYHVTLKVPTHSSKTIQTLKTLAASQGLKPVTVRGGTLEIHGEFR